VDFSRALGIPVNAARELALPALDRLHRAQPAALDERGKAAGAAKALQAIAEREGEAIQESIRTGGLNAGREHLKRSVK
jgi:hypothetical protein